MKSMKSKVITALLVVAALALGIIGCRSNDTDYRYSPYQINYLSSDESVMDDVLKAAVRHKCLPQVVDDCNVTCTSVQNGIVVKVRLNRPTLIIQPKKDLAKKIDKDEYNEWVEGFGQEIRNQLSSE